MLALYGTGVSKGISIGYAYVLQSEQPEITEYVLPEHLIDGEIEHFLRSIETVRHDLQEIRKQIPSNAPAETSSFIDMHLLILEDRMLSDVPIDTIRNQRLNAAWALRQQSDLLCEQFERMDDPYLRTKKVDILQVVNRVLKELLGIKNTTEEHPKSGDIVIANDLSPADTVLLIHNRIKAFITDLGGPISHTAILARSLGIPAIVATHNATRFIRSGDDILVDGGKGAIIINPDKHIISEFRKRKKQIQLIQTELKTLKSGRSFTRDGKKIKLLANIELPADIKAANNASAEGIGLYRTEFLYMNRRTPPTEEEQYRTYTKVIKALGNKLVTIRTLDLGADKPINGSRDAASMTVTNPALGLRAIRLCLKNPSLFKPQLRAIFRASAVGRVKLMIPMLSNLDELFRVLDMIDEVKFELKREKLNYNPRTAIGGMIEVPAAAISADLFSPYLDYLSIGTNDLIQYTLAIDRVDDAVSYLYDPTHPAVLRLILNIIKAGHNAGIPVSMCGEMAGDPDYTRLLLGMGLREFSMHPATLLEIKKIVRTSNVSDLQKHVKRIMRTQDIDLLHKHLDHLNYV